MLEDPNDTLLRILDDVNGAPLDPTRIVRLEMSTATMSRFPGITHDPTGGMQLSFKRGEHDRATWSLPVRVNELVDEGEVIGITYLMTVDMGDAATDSGE